jgi:hypothetical protein
MLWAEVEREAVSAGVGVGILAQQPELALKAGDP